MTPRRGPARLLVLGWPAAWLAVFVLLPLLVVARISLSESALARPPYRPQAPASLDLEAWREFLGALTFDNVRELGATALYGEALASSLGLAFAATVIAGIVGYAMALAISRASPRHRPILLAAVVLPFWTSFLVRVYAWVGILKTDGWLNTILLALGILREPLTILNTDAGILIGLVYAYLPFMILPVYAVLDRQDGTLLEASADLGASPFATFWLVTFPLSLPGVAAGSLLCFIPMVGEFVVPELLGGSDTLMLGRVIWSEFFQNRNWPMAAAAAVLLLVVLAGPILALRRIEARFGSILR